MASNKNTDTFVALSAQLSAVADVAGDIELVIVGGWDSR